MPEFQDNPQDLYLSVITNIDASIPITLESMPELQEDNAQDLYGSPLKDKCLLSVSPQSLIANEWIYVAPGKADN